jgi:signal transduction histidine kinase
VAAAQWLAEDLEHSYGIAVRVDAEDDGATPLDEALRVTLFRALRELLINVARHAGTAQAFVRIRCRDGRAAIEVEDRGVGFDSGAVNRGFGLRSVCDRVEHMGGEVRIDSRPGEGTTIRACAPIGRARERGGA